MMSQATVRAPPAEQPSWDHLASFLAVMREGSLSGAARSLGLSQPTLRRQIEKLEEVLGAVLFTRSSLGLAPTETALATLRYAESIAGVAEALVRTVSGAAKADEGTVRVTCSEVVGIEVLPPMLVPLRKAHPRIQVELVPTNENEDLLRRDADVAVRMARPTQAGLVASRVGAVEVGLFASESYCRENPPPRTLEGLAHGHALIGRDRSDAMLAVFAAAGLRLTRRQFALRTDSDAAQLSAIRAGLGIGVCQRPLASRLPALRRVLPTLGFPLEVWVVTHENLRHLGRVSIVFDHLVESFMGYLGKRKRNAPPTK